MFKSPAEIAHMERSGRIADTAFEALFNELRPGMLETEAAAVVVNAMHREGAIESFRTCVVGGKLSGLKHAYPRERKLELRNALSTSARAIAAMRPTRAAPAFWERSGTRIRQS